MAHPTGSTPNPSGKTRAARGHGSNADAGAGQLWVALRRYGLGEAPAQQGGGTWGSGYLQECGEKQSRDNRFSGSLAKPAAYSQSPSGRWR